MVGVFLIGLGLVAVGFASGLGSAVGSLFVKLVIEPRFRRFHKRVGRVIKVG